MRRRDFMNHTVKLVAAGLLSPPWMRDALGRDGARRRAGAPVRGARSSASGSEAASGLGGTSIPSGPIVVMVNLGGGNDGLNMVVPIGAGTYGLYQAARPTLAIPLSSTVPLDAETGLHPSLAPLAPLWETGELAVVQGLSYPEPNLSHFRSTDIWFSGSSSQSVIATGWLARYLEAIHPEFPGVLPGAPFGLQQGFTHVIPLTGERGTTGVVVADPGSFYDLVGSGYTGPWSNTLPDTRGGEELEYIRQVDTESFEYAESIQAAAEAGSNTVAYPGGALGNQLQVVAQLISGQLDTPFYLTALSGFDTHTNQAGVHSSLLAQLAQSIAAFMTDLANQGLSDDVVLVTTSEFGRRVNENGGLGTDHGTAAPHFVLGTPVLGGVYGTPPDLEDLTPGGNLKLQFDYRSVYATLLRGHLGASSGLASQVLFGDFDTIPFLSTATAVGEQAAAPVANRLLPARPNPVSLSRAGGVRLSFDLARPGRMSVRVFDVQGRQLSEIARGDYPAGHHRIAWRPRGLAAGTYFIRLQTGGWQESAKLLVLP